MLDCLKAGKYKIQTHKMFKRTLKNTTNRTEKLLILEGQ